MKRTVKLPDHFEGDVHLQIGSKTMKLTITKAAGTASQSKEPYIDEDGNICHLQCFEKDKKGRCIDWRIVCHAPGDTREWEK